MIKETGCKGVEKEMEKCKGELLKNEIRTLTTFPDVIRRSKNQKKRREDDKENIKTLGQKPRR